MNQGKNSDSSNNSGNSCFWLPKIKSRSFRLLQKVQEVKGLVAKEDEVLARYFSDNERYADLINGIGFGGRTVIKAEDLSDRDTKTGYH